MPNFGAQPVHLYNRDNVNVYDVTADRDILAYPDTVEGARLFGEDVLKGMFVLTVDNGAIISKGTLPPLTRPVPPAAVSFSTKIQGEDMPGNTTGGFSFEGTTMVGGFTSAADQRTASLPIVGTNPCQVAIRYQTNTASAGNGSISVNNGALIDFAVVGAEGGQRTVNVGFTPIDGANTIRIQGKDGTTFFLDYIIVSRTA